MKKTQSKINDLKLARREINKEIKELADKIEALDTERSDLDYKYRQIGWQLQDLNRDLTYRKSRTLRFPRIKTPDYVTKAVRKSFRKRLGWATKSTTDNFVNVLYYDGEQWIHRTYAGIFGIDKKKVRREKHGYTGRYYRLYKECLAKIIEVSREYEDGRAFKSGRIRQFMGSVSVFAGDNKSAITDCELRRVPYVSARSWASKYGDTFVVMGDEVDPALDLGVAKFAMRRMDTMRVIRYYKKYKLARQLYSIGETDLAFNGQILRSLKGERLLAFKNWWQQSTDSGWFRWKPKDYSAIKEVVLTENLSQLDIFRMEVEDSIKDERLVRYLFRQRERTLWRYNDYVKMLEENGYPLSYSLLYPRDLRAAHAAMVNRKSAIELEQLRIERDLSGSAPVKYEEVIDEALGLVAKPLVNASDFKDFGNYMSHCYKDATRYWEDFINNEIVLFAVCNLVTNEPYFVAQYDVEKKEVTQNLGMRNGSIDADGDKIAIEFANKMFGAAL